MMKTILGSAIGGLVAGALALTASAYVRNAAVHSPAPAFVPFGVSDSMTRAAAVDQGLVQCEPHQDAVVRRIATTGGEVAGVACVSRAPMPAASYDTRVVYVDDMVTSPVVRPRVVERPATVARVVSAESRAPAQTRQRSWAKTALLIGGGTGAGAGVGGLVGGKKGALIGAAIGAGATSIYEVTRR